MSAIFPIRGETVNKHERDSIRKYDSISKNYDETPEGHFTSKFKEKVLELCTVSNGDRVLDVGCGNGSLIATIASKENVQAYGVDISPNMIEECRKKHDNIPFEVSNGEHLNFDDDSLDIVTICCALHHLSTPQNFFKEAQRVLKQNGTLIVAEPWFPFGLRHFFDYVISPLLRAGDNKLFSHGRLKQLFLDNGFSLTDIYKKGFMQVLKAKKP